MSEKRFAVELPVDSVAWLTKRELFAAMAMQKMSVDLGDEIPWAIPKAAEYSVALADALIAALEKKP